MVGFRYAKADGESSRRLAEPYGLVDAGHRWCLVAWDLGREDWRTFRADRFGSVPVPRGRFTPRPLPGTDLAGMGFAFKIIEPAEFRDRARELGSRLSEAGRAERPAS